MSEVFKTMVGPEQPQRRFNLREQWKKRRELKERISLINSMQKWEDEINGKAAFAKVQGLPARFTHNGLVDTIPENGYYYSVFNDPESKTGMVVIERDRERGRGEGHAVVYRENEMYVLETVNSIEPSGDKNPYEWKVVSDVKQMKRFLEEQLGSFKDVSIMQKYDRRTWRGRYQDPNIILASLPEKG